MESLTDPLFLSKAKRLYAALDALAEDEFVDGLPARLFRGQLQAVYKGVRPKLSSSHYSRILRGMKQCGSLTQLQRGARNTETIIVLHHEPTVEQWMAYERSPLTGKIDYASLRQRIDEIEGTEDDKRDALQQLAEEVERQGQALESLTKQVEALKPK
jgi:hypothetical protein